MKLFEKLFGKWEVVETFPAVLKESYMFINSENWCKVVVKIEKNNKKNKERAYYVGQNGNKAKVDPNWAREYLK